MSNQNEQLAEFLPIDVESVIERELAHASYCTQHSTPTAILLAGQPGAGKTVLASMLNKSIRGDALFINADEYRRY